MEGLTAAASKIIELASPYWTHVVSFLSGGGVVKLWEVWRSMPRVVISMQSDNADTPPGLAPRVAPVFEVENIGGNPTSLNVEVTFTGYNAIKRTRLRRILRIDDPQDLSLPPYIRKRVRAVNFNMPEGYVFTWYRTYTFSPTRGWRRRVRVWNASCRPIGWLRFYIMLSIFRLTGWVPDQRPTGHF
jgi:hypothetical protein